MKGYRTYLSILGVIMTALIGVYGQNIVVLSPEVTIAGIGFFSALAAYFRKLA